MKTIKFRDLRADEIELRVGATNDKGFSLLLYKTARVDANILDETVGCFNWQKRFYQVKNTMICEISINANYDDPSKEPYWISKSDGGDESNTEAIKGECSDAMKRAAFQWNIGRTLYSSPFIWITKDENNDPKKSHYIVSEIAYQNNEISKLVIINEKTKQVVFSKGSTEKVSQIVNKTAQARQQYEKGTMEEITKGLGDTFNLDNVDDDGVMCSAETKSKIQEITGHFSAERYGKFKTYMKTNFGCESIGELTESQGQQLLKVLGGK